MNSELTSEYPLLIAWEVTRRCQLRCKHCRASALDIPYSSEFTFDEMKRGLDSIATFAKPIIILTGGEPMMRDDIYDIASYGDSLGLRMVMAPCGPLVTPKSLVRMKGSGIRKISLSIDGIDSNSHDAFRNYPGSFDSVLNAAELAREAGMPFQINSTITRGNVSELRMILELVVSLGASSFHPFLFVPMGRGRGLCDEALTADEYELALSEIATLSKEAPISVKPTCAPHYARFAPTNSNQSNMSRMTRGCLAGTGFAFISHIGVVQTCGFLEIPCGDLRDSDYDFAAIWKNSPIFQKLRLRESYKGKCGICDYFVKCGGCRARAFAKSGDYLGPEPSCSYIPKRAARETTAEFSDEEILNSLQEPFAIQPRLFKTMALKNGISEGSLLEKISSWRDKGLVRYIASNINLSSIGFKSALIAARLSPTDFLCAKSALESHPGVSHAYLRGHDYNLWFTLRVPDACDLEEHARKLGDMARGADLLVLPAIKTFKLRVAFDAVKGESASIHVPGDVRRIDRQNLTIDELKIVDALHLGIPIEVLPFARLAEKLGIAEELLCERIISLQRRKILKPLHFTLNHRSLGLNSNALVAWNTPTERIDVIGEAMARYRFVSHCYLRSYSPPFPYSLFTMIHARDDIQMDEFIKKMSEELNIKEYTTLITKEELVKRKATIQVEKYFIWMRSYLGLHGF